METAKPQLSLATVESEEFISLSAMQILDNIGQAIPLQDLAALCAVMAEVTREGICHTAEQSGVDRAAFMAWLDGIQTRAREKAALVTESQRSKLNKKRD